MMNFPDVNYRYIIQPSKPLKNSWLDLEDRPYIYALQKLGRIDGETAIMDGEGFIHMKLKEWMNNAELSKKEYTRIQFMQ